MTYAVVFTTHQHATRGYSATADEETIAKIIGNFGIPLDISKTEVDADGFVLVMQNINAKEFLVCVYEVSSAPGHSTPWAAVIENLAAFNSIVKRHANHQFFAVKKSQIMGLP